MSVALFRHRLCSTCLLHGLPVSPTGALLNPCLGGHPQRSLRCQCHVSLSQRRVSLSQIHRHLLKLLPKQLVLLDHNILNALSAVNVTSLSANVACRSAKFIDTCSSCCRSSSFSSTTTTPLQQAPGPDTHDNRVRIRCCNNVFYVTTRRAPMTWVRRTQDVIHRAARGCRRLSNAHPHKSSAVPAVKASTHTNHSGASHTFLSRSTLTYMRTVSSCQSPSRILLSSATASRRGSSTLRATRHTK